MLPVLISTLLFAANGTPTVSPHDQLNSAYKSLQTGDLERAAQAFLNAANAGDSDAQVMVGDLHLGGRGVAKDPVKSAYWYARAAQHSAVAQWKLGALYQQGLGAPQNYDIAAAMYTRAADAGLPDAQNSLANMYFAGLGVQQDIPRAMALYRQAAAQECADAQTNLASAYYFGAGVKGNLSTAREWAVKARANGSIEAADLLKRIDAVGKLEN